MTSKWKTLLVVASLVVAADQWSKYVAVEQLTPAVAQPEAGPPLSPEAHEAQLAQRGMGEKLGAFWSVRHPCQRPMARCPVVRVMPSWNFRYVENPGAAWGFLAGASESVRVPFFLAISLGAIIFILLFFRRMEESQRLMAVALSLIFGGALGNFIDRLHLNYVVDFIDWYVGEKHWPTFNVADAAISVGVFLLIVMWQRDPTPEEIAEATGAPAPEGAPSGQKD